MTIIAIIAEYNPMHNGHIYQINKIKKLHKDAHILVVMSGHFCQRGGACLYDKWTRADIAVSNGVDLVLQLPEFFSTQSAPIFSGGSINLLNSLNCVDYLYFSTETYSSDELKDIYYKQQKNKDSLKEKIKHYLAQGYSYPKSISMANNSLNIKSISLSNDILGYEYVKALIESKSAIIPQNIQRVGSGHKDEDITSKYPSSTTIRKSISNADVKSIYKYIAKKSDTNTDTLIKNAKFDSDFLNMIKYSIADKIERNSLHTIYQIDEGIDNKIAREYLTKYTLNDLITSLKSKRYTHTKISRMLFNCLLNITKDDIKTIIDKKHYCPYARVLAFNNKGRTILSIIKQTSHIPIISKVANFKADDIYISKMLQKDIYATKVYNINQKSTYYSDYLTSPIYKK